MSLDMNNNNNSILKLDKSKSDKLNEVRKRLRLDNNQSPGSLNDHVSKYSYRLWNIRLADLDPEDKYLKQKSYSFKLESKFIRFSGFNSFNETRLLFSRKKGLEIKTNESESEISMVISSEDILYCACVFHAPIYMLFIKIGDVVANTFYDELKSLKNFNKNFKANLINLTRIVVFLKTNEAEIGLISNNLKRFFESISMPAERPRRLDFLNLKKSKELIASEFENDQEILKEIYEFITE
ncbi:unnamed protein product [Brachionus calyciflorus]|uniref:Uncharacterized protein n=1 Tax=Brachionus calyciflorus TaxID=104777 RepID=A0A814DXT5_9BILA|nr:unnamed protein product [Brachionus calyciflorus]